MQEGMQKGSDNNGGARRAIEFEKEQTSFDEKHRDSLQCEREVRIDERCLDDEKEQTSFDE